MRMKGETQTEEGGKAGQRKQQGSGNEVRKKEAGKVQVRVRERNKEEGVAVSAS